MLKRLIILLLFSVIVQSASAQGTISGIIADSVTMSHIPFVTVRLSDQNQALLKSSISDSTGRFHFEKVIPGTYQLHFSIMGYSLKKSDLFHVNDTSLVLPVFLLHRSDYRLAEVTVIAQRPLISTKIDGFVYNAAQDIQSAGETAADLLTKIPGVQVDPNGTASMRGSSRIKVFIDGRPSVTMASSIAEALRQISADNIKTVEVITHPSARYDAEGVDGVINILTKKPADDGVSGTVNGILATRFHELTGLAIRRKQKLITTVNGGYSNSGNVTISTLERAANSTGITDLIQKKELNNDSKGTFGDISILYLADSLAVFNAGYRYSADWFTNNSLLNNSTGSDIFTRNINNPIFRYLHSVNAGWTRKSKDRSMEYAIMGYWFYQGQFAHYLLDQYRRQQRDYSEKNRSSVDNSELSLQADITKKFKGGDELEAGIKYAFRKYSYESLFDVFDFSQSVYLPENIRADRFWFKSPTLAAYVSYTLDLDSWKIRPGMRYEYNYRPLHFRDISLNVSDGSFLPNLVISKTISSRQNMSIGYARKILRPYINYLNPVINYIDSLNLEYGNPYLKPAITNSYDLSYTFQKPSWLFNLAAFYNRTGNNTERVRIQQPDGIVAYTYANVAVYTVSRASISTSLRLKHFTIAATNTTRYLEFSGQNTRTSRNGYITNQSMDISFKPNPSFTIRVYANLNTRNISLQGSTTGVRSYTLSVNKEFLNGKVNLSGRCDNLFAPYRHVTDFTGTDTFQQQTESRYINRSFRVAVRWKLGKKDVNKPQIKEIRGF